MSKKVAVITGSSSGIGAATARLFARNGYNVVINFSRNPEPANVVAEQCRALGADVLVMQADVAQDTDCRALAAAVDAKWQRADALVNNAGTTKFVAATDLDGLSAQDFHDIYAVNVIGAYQMIRAFAPLMQRNPGAGIVNVSSVASVMGSGSCLAYMASKGALNAMTFGMARALAPAIRVNAVGPGLVETPWLQQGMGIERYDAMRTNYEKVTPLASTIQPDDVADACFWLCNGAARTTGEFILVDSGFAKFPTLGR
ncbi:SDR family oxidoreductase [Actimicrobium sp. CCI2.3]|uniref:SDR family NAD(P)-dependent oxidoreductase n=1 Tax=Actimicrobium sp. CCI2.3 TaxID=3048616 RepID=UPI002AB4C945|nr:SDR family oxidoreductase [Actimicrobium sp. CCI2.3]MDY7573796.1 SDR family oxidoreductase [Actimicrobium sp. CCI2.3]MEB0022407.1 SDR family oxidoreductase [Actimicrobium sp. CCI2.3]